jgi:serine protease Do
MTLGELPNAKAANADTDNNDRGKSANGNVTVPNLGLTLAPANSVAGAGKEGVVVTDVDPNSPSAERGFKEGDVILEVAGKLVSNPSEVRDAITTARNEKKNSVLVRVKSGDSSRFIAMPVAKG